MRAFMLAMLVGGRAGWFCANETPLVPMMAPDKKGVANLGREFWLRPGISRWTSALVSVLQGSKRRGDVYHGGALFIQRHPSVQFLKAREK